MPLLELRRVWKGYGAPGARTEVLGGIDFSIEAGEFVSIVSHSGAGKTTLISVLAGLAAPDAGEVRSASRPVCSVLFKNRSLQPWMTVQEHVASCLGSGKSDSAAELADRVERVLALAGLSGEALRKPPELSDGQRRRLSLARALAPDPQILLMDEPSSGLDPASKASLQDELGRLREDSLRSIVLVTHDIDEALLLSDRILPMTPGPSSILGPSFALDLPRPRDRRLLAVDPRCLRLRDGILDFLQGSARLRRRALATAHA